jgi:hypothetical protein
MCFEIGVTLYTNCRKYAFTQFHLYPMGTYKKKNIVKTLAILFHSDSKKNLVDDISGREGPDLMDHLFGYVSVIEHMTRTTIWLGSPNNRNYNFKYNLLIRLSIKKIILNTKKKMFSNLK